MWANNVVMQPAVESTGLNRQMRYRKRGVA